jgi:hypothetical protein
MSEDRKRISRIFGKLDMALLTLGNWIDHGEQRATRDRARVPPPPAPTTIKKGGVPK